MAEAEGPVKQPAVIPERMAGSPAHKHLDEARQGAIDLGRELLEQNPSIRHAVIVIDLIGRISLVVWGEPPTAASQEELNRAFQFRCGWYWTGNIISPDGTSAESEADPVARSAWAGGYPLDGSPKVRLNDRFRHHTAWRTNAAHTAPLWPLAEGPPLVVFHAFKGGVGRTTLLAGYALARARRGERVAVVDMDLDAPGVGTLLAADQRGTSSRWGTVDFLLENAGQFPFEDYLHVCARDSLTGAGRIDVVPAGQLDDAYLPKLARVDLETQGDIGAHPIALLLKQLRARGSDLILIDGRAGLSPAAGLLLSGIAHLHVLVATSNPQSLAGLERVVRHLGLEAAKRGELQGDVVVVQALVPEGAEAAAPARESFASRTDLIFREGYYARERSEEDALWSLDDMESVVAPHVPVPIPYRAALAHYSSIDAIADLLMTEHAPLHARLDERLGVEERDARSAKEELNEDG